MHSNLFPHFISFARSLIYKGTKMKFWMILICTMLFLTGCATQRVQKIKQDENRTKAEKPKIKKFKVKQKPKRKIKLKEVQDDNFSPEYMYPEDKVKKEKVAKSEAELTEATQIDVMNKEECIGMIGQEKFYKYAQMFGSESASIKRCAMLKTVRK